MSVFRVPQSLTVANAKTVLEHGLQAIAEGRGEFDFAEVNTVDSAAVATLLAWQRAAGQAGKTLVFSNIPASLQSLTELYGVTDLLPRH